MKNIQKLSKIFFDTSALLSGLNSPSGASGIIISFFKLKKIILIISPEVILETERVIKNKFPLLEIPFFDFLTSRPIITQKVTLKEIKSARAIVNSEDTPILAGAIKSRADFLITLDKKFYIEVKNKTKIKILFPSEFLRKFRKSDL
ncbi:MAG: putative toxin-antitoxin system toxin component, PIN family [Patescibacteria group bacterium]|nr:putative toxin-antitoxin system toxin component, PIN family [Patescibacteria group bacterium]